VPIVYLTARDATEDKIRGSRWAATTTSPSRSASRSSSRGSARSARSGLAEADSGRLVFADLELDEDAHEVTRGGDLVELTPAKYRLLRYLMLNPRRPDAHAAARARVGLRLRRRTRDVLETYVSYLRKKPTSTDRR